jgi:hypothetical protein
VLRSCLLQAWDEAKKPQSNETRKTRKYYSDFGSMGKMLFFETPFSAIDAFNPTKEYK